MTNAAATEAIKTAMRSPWDPKTWPFRVTFWASTGGYSGRYVSKAYTFATLEEAEAFIVLTAPVHPRGAKACVDVANEGPGGWVKTGRWVAVKRK